MKHRKIITCIALVLTMCVSLSMASVAYVESLGTVTPKNAEYRKHKSKWSEQQAPEWAMYVNGMRIEVGSYITIGYDTWCTNEDYVKNVGGSPSGVYAQGRIYNSNGYEYTEKVYGSKVGGGKAEIKHTTKNLCYGVIVGWPEE